MVKNLPANTGDAGSFYASGRSCRRKWQSIPVFLPGKSHGQRNLVSYSPWGCKRAGHDLGTKQQNRQGMGRQCKRTEEYTVIPAITFQNIIVKEIR